MRDNRKIRRRQRCPGCGSLEVIKWGVRNGNKGLKACPCRGRWICKMASDGRDFPAKARPVEPQNAVHRARFRMTVSARFFRCSLKEKMHFERAIHQPLLSLSPTKNINYTTSADTISFQEICPFSPLMANHREQDAPHFTNLLRLSAGRPGCTFASEIQAVLSDCRWRATS